MSSVNTHTDLSTSRADIDSHADTCAFGDGALIHHETGQKVTVHPFTEGLESMEDVAIVTACLAYDCPNTYQTYILFFPQSLYIPGMENHLLCPAQLRQNAVRINEVPLIHTPKEERSQFTHSIWTEHPDPEVHIPLELDGVISCFTVRKPTQAEVQDDRNAIHVYMTSDSKWDPQDQQLAEEESQLRALYGGDYPPQVRGHTLSQLSSIGKKVALTLDVDSHAQRLLSSTTSSKRKGTVSAETLAKRWQIGLDTAQKTVE